MPIHDLWEQREMRKWRSENPTVEKNVQSRERYSPNHGFFKIEDKRSTLDRLESERHIVKPKPSGCCVIL